MIEVIVCSAAEHDYAQALSWYTKRSIQAAERFDAEFDFSLQTISADPERFPRCDDRHRYYLMRYFPFQVIYRRHENYLVVIAVAHTARNSQFWANR